MNILFCHDIPFVPEHDGIGRITKVLRDFFISKGNNVYTLSFHEPGLDEQCIDGNMFLDSSDRLSESCQKSFLSIIHEKEITHIINQSGSHGQKGLMTELIWKIKNRRPEVKVISVIHAPLFDAYRNANATYHSRLKENGLGFLNCLLSSRIVRSGIVNIQKKRTRKYYSLLEKNSDYVVLLGKAYIGEYKELIKKDSPKIVCIGNPISIKCDPTSNKSNMVLYVGRISFSHKQTDLLVRMWKRINNNGSWVLHILGDGPDRLELEKIIKDENIDSVVIHGQTDPTSFYKESKILCMTSSFEGFPLVLLEGMGNGVVPIAFNSFGAAIDIVDDKKDGYLVSPFDKATYVKTLQRLMDDDVLLNALSVEAIKKSRRYSLDCISQEWLSLLNDTTNQQSA